MINSTVLLDRPVLVKIRAGIMDFKSSCQTKKENKNCHFKKYDKIKIISLFCHIIIFFPWLDKPSRPRPPLWVPRSHSITPHSVGLLWTSDQPEAETST